MQSCVNLIVHVGVGALHDLAHEPFALELENLVGHVHLVYVVVVAVESRRGGLVGRVFDDDRGGAEEHLWGLGISVPSHSAANEDGQQEPLPLGHEVEEQVHHVESLLLAVAVLSACCHVLRCDASSFDKE